MNYADVNGGNTLITSVGITVPVFAYIKLSAGQELYNYALKGSNQRVTMGANAPVVTRNTYNVIAEKNVGNPNSVVMVGAHYDSLFGAGIVDNISGVASVMEIARVMANTPTVNKLRFAFWGGEEESTVGSLFYVNTLPPTDLNKIVYYLDFDVTATNNYSYILLDPAYAIAHPSGAVTDTKQWKNNAVNLSNVGVSYFKNYLANPVNLNGSCNASAPGGLGVCYTSKPADLYISGSDTDPFILAGIPIAGIVTGQGDGKTAQEAATFGGVAGNYERCGDSAYIFCDNICNTSYYSASCGNPILSDGSPAYATTMTFTPLNNPHTVVTKASTDVAVRLLFNPNLANNGLHKATGQTSSGMSRYFSP